MAALAEAMSRNEFLNYVVPVPDDLKDTISGAYGDAEAQAKLEAQQRSNVEKYGYSTWYDFCIANWSTKWEVETRDSVIFDGVIVTANFDSAWAPPTKVYDALVEDGYDVVAYYYEPGMGFLGKFDNGVDQTFDTSYETSKTIRSVIGAELDDQFGISESMAEWEAENQDTEELTEWIRDGAEAREESLGK